MEKDSYKTLAKMLFAVSMLAAVFEFVMPPMPARPRCVCPPPAAADRVATDE